jgi:hypothetical protein
MKKLIIISILISGMQSYADEGLWIPFWLEETCYNNMVEQGLLLSSNDIYSNNQACLKDAVVIFGDGCTGVIVSDEGLLFTNHHCAYSYVQNLSTPERNYLENGFWAYGKAEELPVPSLFVRILVETEDVTNIIFEGTNPDMSIKEREKIIQKRTKELINERSLLRKEKYQYMVKSVYGGSQYLLYCYEEYRDIRLAGVPPISIGKFGGDTDNWIWPRHNADFAVFRIYADRNNLPAEYASDNVPYHPRKSVAISIRNLTDNMFSFVMGYPSRTHRFVTSHELNMTIHETYPQRILLHEQSLDIWKSYIEKYPQLKIKYAVKYAGVSNTCKRWKGVISGINHTDGVLKKQQEEQAFMQKIASSREWMERYGHLMDDFKSYYAEISKYNTAYEIVYGGLRSVELFQLADKINRYLERTKEPLNDDAIEDFPNQWVDFYKKFNLEMDKEIFIRMTTLLYRQVSSEFYPEFYLRMDRNTDSLVNELANELYDASALRSLESLQNWFLGNKQEKFAELINDPAIRWVKSVNRMNTEKLAPYLPVIAKKIDSLYGVYAQAVLQVFPEKENYPDADQTLRVSYGKMQGYSIHDVCYTPQTDIDGLMKKNESGITEYSIPLTLKELYRQKNYGVYGEKNTLPTCFITDTHTSSGNSGSPVFNAKGELIGLNFDRNWEGTMSDVLYDPEVCRNIAADMRYVLFIIDKYAKADYLLNEFVVNY